MLMNNIIMEIQKCAIVPVVVLDDVKDAIPLAAAIRQGGINLMEITFRTPVAYECIIKIRESYPDMILGAGTVLTPEQVRKAKESGASFVVSPGFNYKVVSCCQEEGITIIPGCMTPTEIENALDSDLTVVKFFPAEAAGGVHMIRAMSAPYGDVKFMPTGGINLSNVEEYLKEKCVLACGGSWMVKQELIRQGKFERITELTREAAQIAKRYRA